MASKASTQSTDGTARLIPLGSHAGAAPIEINRPVMVVGSRKEAVRLHLESSTVSKAHCVIILHSWGCSIHDLASRTHTIVNGQSIQNADLQDGDQVRIGRFEFKYKAPSHAIGTRLVPMEGELDVSTLTDPLPLTKQVIQIGRRRGSDLQFDDKAVSNVHAIIFERNGRRFIRDLTSRTGTWLNGALIHQEELLPGARLRVGPAEIVYREAPVQEFADAADLALPVVPLLAPEPPQIAVEVDEPAELSGLELLSDEPVEEAAPAYEPVAKSPQVESEPDTALPLEFADEATIPTGDAPRPAEPELDVDTEIDDDALTALRKGWHGVSRVQADEIDINEPLALDALDRLAPVEPPPLEPVAEQPPEIPVKVAAEVPEEASDVDRLPSNVEIDEVEFVDAEPIAKSHEVVEDEIVIEEAAIEEPVVETPAVAETPAEPEVPGVDEIETIDVSDQITAASPAHSDVELIDALIEAADAEIVDDEPLDLDAILGLAPSADEAADSPIAALTPVDDITDDDGAIDLDEAPAAPASEALIEPELALEPDDIGLEPIAETISETTHDPTAETVAGSPIEAPAAEPVAEVPDEVAAIVEPAIELEADIVEPVEKEIDAELELIEPERVSKVPSSLAVEIEPEPTFETVLETPAEPVAEIPPPMLSHETIDHGELLAEDDVLDDLSNTLYEPEMLADKAEDDDDVTAPTLADAATMPEIVVPEIVAPEPESAGVDAYFRIGELDPVPVDLADLNTAPPARPETAAIDLVFPTGETISSPDLSDPVAEVPATKLEIDAVDLNEFIPAVSQDINDDTAFAIGLDDLDPFDMDDEEPADAAVTAGDAVVTNPEPTPVTETTDVIVGDRATQNDSADSENFDDLAEIMNELGITVDEPSGISVDGEGTDFVEQHETGLVAEARSIDDDIDALMKSDQSSDQSGSLSDLIPKGPPLVGGFFAPQSHGMMLGGSPMVNLSGPPPAPPAPARPAQKPASPVSRGLEDEDDDLPPPPASPKQSPEDRRRPMRVGFSSSGTMPSLTSPFAPPGKTIGDVLIGRRAPQSVDVFASPSPTMEEMKEAKDAREAATNGDAAAPADPDAHVIDELASQTSTPEELEILRTADRYRPRGAVPTQQDLPVPDGAESHQHEPQDIAMLRRTRLHRVFLSALLMLPLAAAAGFGAWWLVPLTSKLEATITFNGLDRLAEKDAEQFRRIQLTLLANESTQQEAQNLLDPSVREFGFLSSPITIHEKLAKSVVWPPKPGNTQHLVLLSSDKEADVARLRALTGALIKANSDRVVRAAELRRNIEEDRANISRRQERLEALKDELQGLAVMGDARPDDAAINEVASRTKTAEAELKTARSLRLDVESAIESIKRKPVADLAELPEQQFLKADEKLVALTAQVDDLRKQNEAARTAADTRLAAARKSLDEVIQQLQTDLESTPNVQNAPAELVKYVEGAKRIFSQTRQLTDDLLHRQEQQHTRLSELKTRLSDRIETHARQTLEKDEKLQALKTELEMLTRQQNAATHEGLNTEAKTLSLKMDLIRSLISGREELVKNDPVHQETITSLQLIIDQTQKAIQEDRKHIDEALTKSQEDFTRNAPAVAQLPADQQQVASTIEQRMAAISEARKNYSTTADTADAENAKREAELKEKLASLQTDIQARRIEVMALAREEQSRLAEQVRGKLLQQKATELAAVQEKEAAIQTVLDATVAEQQKMLEVRRRLVETDQERNEKLAQRGQLEMETRQYQAAIKPKEAQLAGLVIPDDKFELQSYDNPDRRPLVAGVSAGAVVALMLIPIVMNLRLISRDSHIHPKPAGEDMNGFDPVLSENGSAAKPGTNGKNSNHESAVPAEPVSVET